MKVLSSFPHAAQKAGSLPKEESASDDALVSRGRRIDASSRPWGTRMAAPLATLPFPHLAAAPSDLCSSRDFPISGTQTTPRKKNEQPRSLLTPDATGMVLLKRVFLTTCALSPSVRFPKSGARLAMDGTPVPALSKGTAPTRPFAACTTNIACRAQAQAGLFVTLRRLVLSVMPLPVINRPPQRHVSGNISDNLWKIQQVMTTLRWRDQRDAHAAAVMTHPLIIRHAARHACGGMTLYAMNNIENFQVMNKDAHREITKLTKTHALCASSSRIRRHSCVILPAVPAFVPILFNESNMLHEIGTN